MQRSLVLGWTVFPRCSHTDIYIMDLVNKRSSFKFPIMEIYGNR